MSVSLHFALCVVDFAVCTFWYEEFPDSLGILMEMFCLVQNIVKGKKYKLVLYVRSLDAIDVSVSLTGSSGALTLATASIK